MKGDKELVGTLKGFDDYVSILFWRAPHLHDAPTPFSQFCARVPSLFCRYGAGRRLRIVRRGYQAVASLTLASELTADGTYRVTNLDQILLNGNNIALVSA